MLTMRAGKIWAVAGVAAIAASLPLAVTATADPEPTPVAPIPDPQGPGCDAFKKALPDWKDFYNQQIGTVIAGIPDISTFSSLISGQANPAVNVVPIFNNGPYVIMAPSNEAFAAMEPGQLDALKADPGALTKLAFYHAFLGYLGPDQMAGQRPTQDGAQVKVTGKGGDLVFNDTAKNVCGGIPASNGQVYIIDAVLDPAQAPPAIGASSTTTTTAAAEEAPPEGGEPAEG